MPRLTLIVKPVGSRCNLTCNYCYNQDPALSRLRTISTMSDSLLRSVLESFLAFSQERYEIIWHGGEPLLAGINFYKKVVEIQKQLAKSGGAKFLNRIQTNGTLITKDWARFFKENDFKVGVSLDGPQWLHDKHRVYSNGEGSYNKTLNGVNHLRNHDLKFAIGAVITKTALKDPIAVFDYMRDNFKVFDFSYCFETIDSDFVSYGLSPSSYTQFVLPVFDRWWNLDDPSIRIRSFMHYVQSALGYTPRICSRDSGCHKFLSVESDGKVYPCGKLSGIEALCLGSIEHQSFHEIMLSKGWESYMTIAKSKSKDCLSCEWLNVCNNGCTATRYTSNGQFLEKSTECEATKTILSHVKKRIEETRLNQELTNGNG